MKRLAHTASELYALLLLPHLLWLLLTLSHLPGEGVLSLSLDVSTVLEIGLRGNELHSIKVNGVLHLFLLDLVECRCMTVH